MNPSPPSASSPRVGVVIVNWNGWRYTLDCLAALHLTKGVSWRAYVVDNASSDDSRAHLAAADSDNVALIGAPANLGWTGGNNLGASQALADGCDFVFFLNNDAVVGPDTLERLVHAAHSPEGAFAALGCVVLTSQGDDYEFAGARMNPKTGVPHWPREEPLASLLDRPLVESAGVCGAAFLAPRALLEKVGPFDEDFYLFFDETDWCARVDRAGGKVLVVRDAVVRHVGRGTVGFASPLEQYFMFRNQLLYGEKHSSPGQRLASARELLYRLRRLEGPASWWFPVRMSPRTRAARRGVIDYLMRRFGDCPPIIRRLTSAPVACPVKRPGRSLARKSPG